MNKFIASFLFFIVSFQVSFAKSVDENTAKIICYNFCKSEGLQATPSDLTLAYVPTTVINGTSVTDFYVFNLSSTGFVIVSGDDNIIPVLAYSTESSFNAGYIPTGISGWLGNYQTQINYVIKNNIAAPVTTVAKWSELARGNTRSAAKTALGAAPLLKSLWNQDPYYNDMCPYDAGAGKHAVTGCVATAMAQVMKYWNWPRVGVGSHSYNSSYGLLSANFGTTYYQWDSMPNAVAYNNVAVAKLNSDAGISVNMSYSTVESGAFVNENTSPITNCAEYALKTYFRYKSSTLQGVFRAEYDDTAWVHLLKYEIDAGRPAIYTGDGSSGGHCWVADGYANADRIHFNWGWGGYCNGYYIVENLTPGGTDFSNGNTLMTGIMPDTIAAAGVNEIAFGTALNVYPNPARQEINIDIHGTNCSQIRVIDLAGREMKKIAPAANAGIVTLQLNDYADGMYFVEMTSAEGVITKKIVVAK